MPTLPLPKRLHTAGLSARILRYLATHPGPHHYSVIAHGVREATPVSVRNTCNRLSQRGDLRWVRPGVYRLALQEE